MKYEFAAQVSEVLPSAMKSVDIEGHRILLANIDGTYYAVQRKCSHFKANLCKGSLTDGVVTCPKHGAQFDVRSGAAIGKANMFIFKMQPKNLQTYPTKINGDKILIGI